MIEMRWTAEFVERFWNYESQFPERYFAKQFGAVMVDCLAKFIPAGSVVMDFGCGPGFLVEQLLSKGYFVWAVDSSTESLAMVNERLGGIPGFLGSFPPSMPSKALQHHRPDAVILTEVVEHLYDEELDPLLSSFKIDYSGSLLIITTPNNEILANSMVYCPCCNHSFHRWQHVRTWTADSLRSKLISQRIEVLAIFPTDFTVNWKREPLRWVRKRLSDLRAKRQVKPNLVAICRL